MRATGRSFPRPFVVHGPEDWHGIRSMHDLLGHSDVKTTTISTRVVNRRPEGIRFPVDVLLGEGRSAGPGIMLR